jgi:putative sigma-54 modulation protein
MIAEATLTLKGVTLRAKDNARDLRAAINLCEEELSRQVKRHREKRRGRRKGATAESIRTAAAPELDGGTQAAF